MNKRMEVLSRLVETKHVIDIGSDHAYLVLNCFKNNIIDQACVCDINIKPLLSGYHTLHQAGYVKQSQFILADGLQFQITDQPTTIVIAGMGGLEIISILTHLNQPFKRLILQPNNHVIELRQYLKDLNLAIKFEDVIEDKNKLYNYLIVEMGNNDYTNHEVYVGRGQSHLQLCQRTKRYEQLSKNIKQHVNDTISHEFNALTKELYEITDNH